MANNVTINLSDYEEMKGLIKQQAETINRLASEKPCIISKCHKFYLPKKYTANFVQSILDIEQGHLDLPVIINEDEATLFIKRACDDIDNKVDEVYSKTKQIVEDNENTRKHVELSEKRSANYFVASAFLFLSSVVILSTLIVKSYYANR